jgi:hypothetical protein
MVNKRKNNQQNHYRFDCGSFEQGVGQGGLGEVVATPSMIVSISLKVLINILIMFPSSLCILSCACLFSYMDFFNLIS